MGSKPQIKIYSSDWCPYCIRAKQLLDSKGFEYEELIVDGNAQLRAQMMQESGRRTVPQIWINQQHIGGCDDLFALERSNLLDGLLNQ
ncbi:glutaredoxin 3 [Reinekea marinisedimentorum]|uniref:Glutaredoxin n=1 Tax=Reinekea marinisedimentorum TaxID=230495 RepID=A0A4R3IBK1_9GAMM|nr:glutaredoxin 3 [Reinekea marinisedimentorum]TCS43023.1 glutaredoxin 3 [Reinekea marinisedimentorum]